MNRSYNLTLFLFWAYFK